MQRTRNRCDIEILWEIRRKVQKNEGVDCAIGGRTGTFCKDRAGHALLSDCSTNERSAFIAVPLPFRGDEDRIGASAITDEHVSDRLLGIRSFRGTYIAKVRWFDYGPKDDTWEPLDNLPRNLVIRYLRQKKKYIPGYSWS